VNTNNMLSEKRGPVGHIIFDNPARLNAVYGAMWVTVAEILEDFQNDNDIRVVVVSGAGGRAFMSGRDITKLAEEGETPEAQELYNSRSNRAQKLLLNMPKPTIAMIRGYCIGGGISLGLKCDTRISSEKSSFAITASKLGVGYDYDGISRLVAHIGPSFAKELFYTARQFSAQEALDMKLINRLVPDNVLEEYVQKYAENIAANAPLTMQAVKQSVLEDLKDPDDRDVALCDRLVDICNSSEDYTEGRRAFMEKRQPVFNGR